MGTMVTLDIRDPGPWNEAIGDAVRWLHRVDRVFSTYRPDSDVSRLRDGTAVLADLDAELTEVLELCAAVERETEGFFTARQPGGIDPTGLVKGWAVERTSELLRSHGSRHHAVNGGGDLQVTGGSAERPWRIGISDPGDPRRIAATAELTTGALATSGNSERGAHIVNPFTGRLVEGLGSVTVRGASLTRVDAYATAAFAMGDGGLHWLGQVPHIEGLVIDPAGGAHPTSGWDAAAGGTTSVRGGTGAAAIPRDPSGP